MRSSEDDGGVRAEFAALRAHGPACHNTLPGLGNRVAPLVNLRSIATPQLDNGVDATVLAPRASLVRIATGRDAADTAFMTVISDHAELRDLVVGAVADTLPDDDLTAVSQLG